MSRVTSRRIHEAVLRVIAGFVVIFVGHVVFLVGHVLLLVGTKNRVVFLVGSVYTRRWRRACSMAL